MGGREGWGGGGGGWGVGESRIRLCILETADVNDLLLQTLTARSLLRK